jgi:chorismate mutase
VKYQNSAPIHDPAREKAVLEQVAIKAAALGVNPQLAQDFFTAQMAASRQYQSELTRLWTRGGTLPAMAPVDLARDIRPKLDTLTGELLLALKSASWDAETRRVVAGELRIRGYSNAVVRKATAAR